MADREIVEGWKLTEANPTEDDWYITSTGGDLLEGDGDELRVEVETGCEGRALRSGRCSTSSVCASASSQAKGAGMAELAYEWIDCAVCGGSGHDCTAWDGLCPICDGTGEVWRTLVDPYDEDEDEVQHG